MRTRTLPSFLDGAALLPSRSIGSRNKCAADEPPTESLLSGGLREQQAPLLLLDIDDVICLNRPYGGYDVALRPWPQDLLALLWHRPALDTLQSVLAATGARVAVTSSWLRVMPLDSIADVFRLSGAPWLAHALHPEGEVLQDSGQTRLQAIDRWLAEHHAGEPYAVLDDTLSGTGLAGSVHDLTGRLVLCDVEVGLLAEHAPRLVAALTALLGQ